ncbi:hypothetical protein AC52_0400 [Escherichia coli 5-366-08_S3_C3]|nr:hypothetical protein CSC22_4029 [Escherichia coli]EFK14816.1 hypothetical protein HMPREF9541_02834 [Escherichia coli MS 116-1]ESD47544.1 hypothetical protein HMPREF1602_01075 [Escherichia coli 907889]KEL76762.1 hypothetical protein AC52_0400 [Escherichia coli 5-366-08_S3_C3]
MIAIQSGAILQGSLNADLLLQTSGGFYCQLRECKSKIVPLTRKTFCLNNLSIMIIK